MLMLHNGPEEKEEKVALLKIKKKKTPRELVVNNGQLPSKADCKITRDQQEHTRANGIRRKKTRKKRDIRNLENVILPKR